MPIDTGETDMFEFFKNHSEVGPFAQVPRSSNVPKDLELFFSKWNAESNDYCVEFSTTHSVPDLILVPSSSEAHELLALHANELVDNSADLDDTF